jgi:phosphatidylglycerophosphate synthase
MDSLYTASAAALAVFLVLGAVDGVYLHLWRYRLHAREASRYEHRLHTVAAVLFAATLPAVFLWETGGVLLWTGIALIAGDLAVSVVDMVSERDSRAELGGLSTGEYVLHMLIMSARGAAIALMLAGREAAAWALDAPWIVGPLPAAAATVAWQALPGAVVMAGLHVWLCTESGVRIFEALRARAGAAIDVWRGRTSDPCCAVRS